MIDIHTHILPNVDDGSDSFDLSVEMLEKEKEIGVSTVILTPHMEYKDECFSRFDIEQKFIEFKKNVEKLGIEILLGAEIYYNEKTLEAIKKGLLPTMNNTKYILLEFNLAIEQFDIAEIAYNFIVSGFKPIIAHPERYPYVDYKKMEEIKKIGALIQVNSSSLLGDFGNTIKRFTAKLLKKGLVDFIASDCHSMGTRCPNLDLCQQKYKKNYPKIKSNFFK